MADTMYQRLAAGELPPRDDLQDAILNAKNPMEGLVLLCAQIVSELDEQDGRLSAMEDAINDMKAQAQIDRATVVHLTERIDALV